MRLSFSCYCKKRWFAKTWLRELLSRWGRPGVGEGRGVHCCLWVFLELIVCMHACMHACAGWRAFSSEAMWALGPRNMTTKKYVPFCISHAALRSLRSLRSWLMTSSFFHHLLLLLLFNSHERSGTSKRTVQITACMIYLWPIYRIQPRSTTTDRDTYLE